MIQKVGQIMLYVTDQDKVKDFWVEAAGFTVISEEDNGQGMRWIEVAPNENAETSMILHNKQAIAEMDPEMNLGTPSMMFFTEDIDQLFFDLKAKGVTVGELVNMPSGRVFNFADPEGNYFAVMQKNE